MQEGFTVTPMMAETAEGEQLVDFSVQSTSAAGGHFDKASEFYEDEQGKLHHHFEDVSLADESQVSTYDDAQHEEYLGAYIDTNPDIMKAVRYAPQYLTQQEMESWDAALAVNDPAVFQQAAEYLMGKFYAADIDTSDFEPAEYEDEYESPIDSQTDPEMDAAIEDWYEQVSDDVVDTAVENLLETEFQPEHASVFGQMASDYKEGSPEFSVLAMGVLVAEGEAQMDDAIQAVINEHGEAKAFAAYTKLISQLNQN